MAEKIVIDPVTRIEGHLSITVEVENGVVKDAWSAGTMFRGFEVLLQGKDPRDAVYVTDRVCGVCTGSHGWASALALDEAFGATVPEAGVLMRNLMMGAIWLHDHPLHFYHLSALDYIDVTAVAQYKGNDPKLNAVKDKIVALVQAGDAHPLVPRYQPDEFSVKDPELVTTAVYHYLFALDMQAKAKRMAALLGGKIPHNSAMVVGGFTNFPSVETLNNYRSLLLEQIDFLENVYLKDVLIFGTGPLLPLAQAGIGGGYGNFMAYGGFHDDVEKKNLFFKPGVIVNGNIDQVLEFTPDKITEEITYSWYNGEAKHPSDGETKVNPDKENAYSFVKAPRYEAYAMEVGPLARMLINKPQVLMDVIKKYNIKPGAVARHAARAVEAVLLAKQLLVWVDKMYELIGKGDIKIHDNTKWQPPKEGKGAGLNEAPRGALGHWVNIKDQKIENYQLVVPSTWNFSPRDDKKKRGPVEEALIGVPVPDPKNPINVVRVVRSFDPCLSCAIHLIEPETNEILKYRVL